VGDVLYPADRQEGKFSHNTPVKSKTTKTRNITNEAFQEIGGWAGRGPPQYLLAGHGRKWQSLIIIFNTTCLAIMKVKFVELLSYVSAHLWTKQP